MYNEGLRDDAAKGGRKQCTERSWNGGANAREKLLQMSSGVVTQKELRPICGKLLEACPSLLASHHHNTSKRHRLRNPPSS